MSISSGRGPSPTANPAAPGVDNELVIVGAGISGLGFAHFAARRGLQPLLIEASARVGGAIHTHRFSHGGGDFWAELGAHTCYNSYGTLIDILRSTGALTGIRPRRELPFRLLADDRLRTITGALSIPRLLLSLPRALWLRPRGMTVQEYFGGLVGRWNFEHVVGPAFDAMTCQPAAGFPADAVFRKKPRDKTVLQNFSGPMGLGSLIDVVAGAVVQQPGVVLRTGMAVGRIEGLAQGWRLWLADGSSMTAGTVVLAVAPDVAARLLHAAAPLLAGECASIGMAGFDSLAMMFEAGASRLPPLAGIIAQGDAFYATLSRDVVPDPRYRAFTFHFRPGVEAAHQLTRACAVLGVAPDRVLDHVVRHNRLPALRTGHAARITAIDRHLGTERLGLVGNWFAGVSIEDSLLRTVAEFQRLYPST